MPWRAGVAVFLLFAGVAAAQSWPLPAHLSTHLTGQPSGDTGVYVWNTWVFRHQLIAHHRSPFATREILPLDGPTDLALHNYTPFADIVALPLQPMLGVVTTFNLIYLLNVTLAGFAMFLLAHRVTGRTTESILAGVMFACAPVMVARSTEHFSLVASAPLPMFLYWIDRAWESSRLRDAAATGLCVAWAWACDPYYAVYCVMLGALFLAGRLLSFSVGRRRAPRMAQIRVLVDAAAIALLVLIAAIHFIGGGTVHIASLSISMRTLYTPVLVLTALVLTRLLMTFRPRLAMLPAPPIAALVRAGAAAMLVALVFLAPTLIALGRRPAGDRQMGVDVQWRSSAPGLDVLAYLLPNPNHPLMPDAVRAALDAQPGHIAEQVGSLSFVVLAVIAVACRHGFRTGRFWPTVAIGFGLLSLGPFVHVAGQNTYVPTPWALLRYVPIVGAARMPARFEMAALVGVAVLFAAALGHLTSKTPRRRLVLTTVAVLLGFELAAVPRTLYSAEIPAIYDAIAADPRDIRVLELPFGVRDGLSSLGDFSASAQYYQTRHEKALVGGYLSRVQSSSKRWYLRTPVLNALLTLSERRPLTRRQAINARRAADGFLAQASLGYVVMNDERVSEDLRQFAIEIFGLRKVAQTGPFALYVPAPAPR